MRPDASLQPTDDGVRIRPLRGDELPWLIGLAAREGWNPGLHDAASFHAADPGGFLVAEAAGEPVGALSAVSYGGRWGFIGLYIVLPAWRRRRVGIRLWQAGMARLAGMPVGLDGVPAQQDNYRRSGFEYRWRNVRFGGRAVQGGDDPPGLQLLASMPAPALEAADRPLFGVPRPAFLRAWSRLPEAHGLVLPAAGGGAGAPWRGWGVIRRCLEGHKVGPLVAASPADADALLRALMRRVPAGDPVVLDVPEPHGAAVDLARGHGLRPVFETARMVRPAAGVPEPTVDLGQVYGITTFELG